jgi:hypothetical protein
MTPRPIIYHGTPLTPRAALLDVLHNRAACVSFYRPDDVEAVEAVCPRIMFRQRGIQFLETGGEAWRGLGRRRQGLVSVLSLAGAAPKTGPLGRHTGHAGCAIPAQRRPPQRLAVRHVLGRAALAYGRPTQSSGKAVRDIRQGCSGMGRGPKTRTCGVPTLPRTDGGSRKSYGQCVAPAPHDERRSGGPRLSVCFGGQHQPRAERVAL